MRRVLPCLALLAVTATGAAVGSAVTAAADHQRPAAEQQSRLLVRSVLAASTVRAGSPPTGGFFSATDRKNAADN